MKKILFILIALAFISSAKAQKKDTTNTDQIFLAAEKQPEFEGGLENFYKFVSSHIQYPQESLKNRIEGKVFVAFVVEKDGSLSDVKILRGLTDDINQESIRVVKISPLWIPGMQNGKAVRSQYTVMLKFKLPAIIPTASLAQNDGFPLDSNKIFTAVEKEPEFSGGVTSFYKYLQGTIRYPQKAKEHNTQGRVFVSFVVEKDGSLSNVRVSRSVSKELDEEALRVIINSPKWIPGMQKGHPVRVQYTMPISFALETSDN